MKKLFVSIIALLMVVCVICGCGGSSSGGGISAQNKQDYQNTIEIKVGSYPYYDSLVGEEKELYLEICSTIKNYGTNSIGLGEYNSEREARNASKELGTFYRSLIFENPEYFWVDPYIYTINTIQQGDKFYVNISPSYIIEKEKLQEKKTIFDQKIDEIVTAAKSKTTDFDKVLFVYDYILDNAKYDHALVDSDDTTDLGRSAYGCLVEGETVCSGYSMAFNIIMRELGIECVY